MDKNKEQYEVIWYTVDKHGAVHRLCPYGVCSDTDEYIEDVQFAIRRGLRIPDKTYLVGSVYCVQKCEYCVDGMSGTNAVLCSYKVRHPVDSADTSNFFKLFLQGSEKSFEWYEHGK